MAGARLHTGAHIYAATIVMTAMLGMTVFAWTADDARPTSTETLMLFTGPLLLIFAAIVWSRLFRLFVSDIIVLYWFVVVLIIPAIHASCVFHVLQR